MNIITCLIIFSVSATGWCVVPSVHITSTNPAYSLINGSNTVVTAAGTNASFSCLITNKPAHTRVKWYLHYDATNLDVALTSDLSTHDKEKYVVDNSTASMWTLFMPDVLVSDSGVYVCRVPLSARSYVDDRITLEVVAVTSSGTLG